MASLWLFVCVVEVLSVLPTSSLLGATPGRYSVVIRQDDLGNEALYGALTANSYQFGTEGRNGHLFPISTKNWPVQFQIALIAIEVGQGQVEPPYLHINPLHLQKHHDRETQNIAIKSPVANGIQQSHLLKNSVRKQAKL